MDTNVRDGGTIIPMTEISDLTHDQTLSCNNFVQVLYSRMATYTLINVKVRHVASFHVTLWCCIICQRLSASATATTAWRKVLSKGNFEADIISVILLILLDRIVSSLI